MIPTEEYVERKFREFNSRMFGGRLPILPIVLSNAKSYLGQCVAKVEVQPDGLRRYYDYVLKISTAMDCEEEIVEDVIIHEMIHYFIFYNNLHDSGPHGSIFKSIMQSINANYGRSVRVSHSIVPGDGVVPARGISAVRVVAVIYFKDGKVGVKALPKVEEKIYGFCSKLKRVREVNSFTLFLTDEPFFSRFPVSVALRVSFVDKAVLEQNLSGAKELKNISFGLNKFIKSLFL